MNISLKTVGHNAAYQELSPHEQLNALLARAGVSKTVYSYVMPETERALDALLDGDRELLRDMYRESWTQKQDLMHDEFFDVWKNWAAPIVGLDRSDFPFVYTTAGASEALRETIYAYGHQARIEGFTPAIHVFDGEYEGFGAYAAAAGISIVTHRRDSWRESLGRIGARDQFYISQPSAIDGNVWNDFQAFVAALNKKQPTAKIMLDLTYVGCVARSFRVETASQNIAAVFISLSKPMGLYYHRVGGVFTRQSSAGLFGNRWFKNLLSLKLGSLMMRRFGVYDLPRRYAAMGQEPAVAELRGNLGLDLEGSDVYMLATAAVPKNPTDLEKYLRRGTGHEKLRLCLTPTIARLVNPLMDATVRARPYERISL
jgi:hypothetical protein